jgi:hypothetical protein
MKSAVVVVLVVLGAVLAIAPARILPEPAWQPEQFVNARVDERVELPDGFYLVDVIEESHRTSIDAMSPGRLTLVGESIGDAGAERYAVELNGGNGPPWNIGLGSESIVYFTACPGPGECEFLDPALEAVQFSFQRLADDRLAPILKLRAVALACLVLAATVVGVGRVRRGRVAG